MRVQYKGYSNEQVKWGNNDDPRGILIKDNIYTVVKEEPHNWHTKYTLEGFVGQFNSVCFVETED